MELKLNKRYWYINNHCLVLYRGKENDKYKFEDFEDRIYYLTKEEVALWVKESE